MSVKLLRQFVFEAVRGWVDPDVAPYLDWSENIKSGVQFGMSPEDFTLTAAASPEPFVSNCEDCVYCAGSGMRDVGATTCKCDICDGSGKIT